MCFSSATLPNRLRARTPQRVALPCAGGGPLPGWRYNSSCYSTRRSFSPATTPPRTAVTIRSTDLHSMRAHPGRDRAQIHRPAAHRPRSQCRPRLAPDRQSPFPRALSASATKCCCENKSPRLPPGEAPPLPVRQPGVPVKTSMRLIGRSSWMSRRSRRSWSTWRFLASWSKRHHRSSWRVGDPRSGVKYLL